MNFKITEEPSKDNKGKPTTLFYLREVPFIPGKSIQATSLTEQGAEWMLNQIRTNAV